MSIVLTNGIGYIEVDYGTGRKETCQKGSFRTVVKGDYVYLVFNNVDNMFPDYKYNKTVDNSNLMRDKIELLYTNVGTPSTASAAELKTTILGWNLQGATSLLTDTNGNVIGSSLGLDGGYSLDVSISDTKDDLVNRSFILRQTATTVSVVASAEDTSITVVDGSTFAVGDDLIIEEDGVILDNHFKVTAKPSANVITLDMPIDIDLSIGS